MVQSPIPECKMFGPGDRVYVRAQQLWIALVAFVAFSPRQGTTIPKITYGELAHRIGLDPKAGITLARALGIIGHYCKMNDIPPLNVIVVNQSTKMPGAEVVVRNGKSVKHEQIEVSSFAWLGVRVPTTGTFRKVWELDDSRAS